MPATPLLLGGREIAIHKAAKNARFEDKKVLTSDVWDYVELWLKRDGSNDALFYWAQAREFYLASESISNESAPLVLYYCFMNAIKALLSHRKIATGPYHGLSGRSTSDRTTISGERIRLGSKGIAPTLAQFLADSDTRTEYRLNQLLYNLPFIHRAYVLTYRNAPELFVPLEFIYYVRKSGSSESWLKLIPDRKGFEDKYIISKLPAELEMDQSLSGEMILRFKKRFRWKDESAIGENLRRLSEYNDYCRHRIVYICGSPPTWYLKLHIKRQDVIDRSGLLLTLMAMHRLSELSRYNPLRLMRLLGTTQNWLVSEFIRSAPFQFVDEVAALITGQNLATPFVLGPNSTR